MVSAENKRVSKNAIALTLRMVLVTIVGLFTSRVVLEALGVEDYGLYGVVGGVVGLAAFLNTSMAGSTSRFITYESAGGYSEKLKNIFSTSLAIHLLLAAIVVLLAETLGLWFLNTKMVIPSDKIFAANVLYQMSVIGIVIGFTQIPYAADIIAHEKMNIYAYFEIVNVILKLAIVYILFLLPSDRLIVYAFLTFLVSLLNAMFYRWYCLKHYEEAKFSLKFNKKIAKEMLSFSGYDLYGNMCVVAQTQGQPIILNLFFGLLANGAASIAMTVTGVLRSLASNFMLAFRPQVIKKYALNEISAMGKLLRRSAQFTLIAFGIVAIPFLLETPYILKLWLGQVPEYTVDFLRIIIVYIFFLVVVQNNNIAVHATGNIKYISFINGTLYLLSPILSYLFLKFIKLEVNTVYIVDAVLMPLSMIVGFAIIHKQIPDFPIKNYCKGISKCFIALIGSFVISLAISNFLIEQYNFVECHWGILLLCFIMWALNGVVVLGLSYIIAMDNADKTFFKDFVRTRFLNKFSKH